MLRSKPDELSPPGWRKAEGKFLKQKNIEHPSPGLSIVEVKGALDINKIQ